MVMNVYVNNFNLLSWPAQLVQTLIDQGHTPIIVDNASTYPDLLKYYKMTKAKVIRLDENLGHQAPWIAGIVDYSDFYAVTDPDLLISGIPRDWPQKCIEGIRMYSVEKCGFSLDESNVPKENPAYILDEFYKYPDGNPIAWGKKLPGGYIDFPVDTTFAVYAPGVKEHSVSGIRTDRPYTARHFPWHIVPEFDATAEGMQVPIDKEIYYYYKHAKKSVSVTANRMQQMIEEFEKKNPLVIDEWLK